MQKRNTLIILNRDSYVKTGHVLDDLIGIPYQ